MNFQTLQALPEVAWDIVVIAKNESDESFWDLRDLKQVAHNIKNKTTINIIPLTDNSTMPNKICANPIPRNGQTFRVSIFTQIKNHYSDYRA